jgi:hypothetical protein
MTARSNLPNFHESIYRDQLLQAQVCKCCDTNDWRSIIAVTFTFKQGIREHGYMFYAQQETCTKAFERFMRRLNRAVYGNATRRFDRRLRVLSVVEKDKRGRWHVHAAIEPPEHMNERQFRRVILRYWPRKNVWAYRENWIELDGDAGWIGYCLKPRQKSGLEAWSDSIDWYSFYNPPVDG